MPRAVSCLAIPYQFLTTWHLLTSLIRLPLSSEDTTALSFPGTLSGRCAPGLLLALPGEAVPPFAVCELFSGPSLRKVGTSVPAAVFVHLGSALSLPFYRAARRLSVVYSIVSFSVCLFCSLLRQFVCRLGIVKIDHFTNALTRAVLVLEVISRSVSLNHLKAFLYLNFVSCGRR